MERTPEEIEILRGPKVRVTTQYVTVDRVTVPICELNDITLVEADPRIRVLPGVLVLLGPLVGVALFLATGWVVRSFALALVVMTIGGVMYRDSRFHQVAARESGGVSGALYRTLHIGDARLFHAALLRAKEMNEDKAGVSGGDSSLP